MYFSLRWPRFPVRKICNINPTKVFTLEKNSTRTEILLWYTNINMRVAKEGRGVEGGGGGYDALR